MADEEEIEYVNLDDLSLEEQDQLADMIREGMEKAEAKLTEIKGPKKDKLDDSATRKKIDSLQARFMMRNPFWATIGGRVTVRVQNYTTWGADLRPLPTMKAATDGESIYFFPKFFKEATSRELDTIYEHEVQHVARAHHLRMGQRDPQLWNIATDHTINNSIIESGGQPPPDGDWLCDPKYKGLEEEKVYRLLKEDHDESGGGESQQGDGQPQQGDQGCVIQPRKEDGSRLSQKEVSQKLQELAKDIEMAKKMSPDPGDSPHAGNSVDLDHTAAKKDWASLLRQFVRDKGSPIGRSWSRLDRRSMSIGVWSPVLLKEGLDHLVIAVDVSGSVMMEELKAFMRQINRLRQQMNIEKITIISFNTGIIPEETKVLKRNTPLPQKWACGGGTLFAPVFEWCNKLPKDPDAVVVFTDMGASDYPDKPKYPVMWASSVPKDNAWSQNPWGEFIEIDVSGGR